MYICESGGTQSENAENAGILTNYISITILVKGTVSPDYKCLEVISIKSPLLGHVTPDL
jgi:hypothetical protein